MRSCLVAAVALALSACASTDDDSGDASSSTGAAAAADPKPDPDPEETTSTGDTSSTGDDTSSTGDGPSETSGSSSSSSTGDASSTGELPGPVCGDGVVEGAEACDDGQETALCDADCTLAACGDAKVNAAAGEACDDGNVDDLDACIAGCVAASCGDGFQQAGVEECDDGNTAPGDGCDESCVRERWAHVGVVKGVAVADLHGWEQCWSGSYEAGDLLEDITSACAGDHIMVGCRLKGSGTLTLAAHAPRAEVFFDMQADPEDGKRHEANGVSWYWAPYYGLVGFGPGGNKSSCFTNGQDDQMCWRVSGNLPFHFSEGYRCGEKASFIWDASWERVLYQAWD